MQGKLHDATMKRGTMIWATRGKTDTIMIHDDNGNEDGVVICARVIAEFRNGDGDDGKC